MKAAVAALELALGEELRLVRELAAAAGRRRDALVSLDAEAVERAASREEELREALALAAERRLRRTSDLALPDAEPSVMRAAAAAEEPARARLRALAAELRQALEELAGSNAAARALTEQSLDHVKRSFALLGGAREPGVYSRRGFPAPASRTRFDALV